MENYITYMIRKIKLFNNLFKLKNKELMTIILEKIYDEGFFV